MFDAVLLLGFLGLLLVWLKAIQAQVKVRSQPKIKIGRSGRYLG
jgi:hypothetical protein